MYSIGQVTSSSLSSRFYTLLLLSLELTIAASLVAELVPPSLLVPIGTEVTFSCNVNHHDPEMYSVHLLFGKDNMKNIDHQQNYTTNHVTFIAIREVNVSCYALTFNENSSSNIAVLQVIGIQSSPLPNPNIAETLVESQTPIFNLTWWPIFLWPGHHIDHYKVFIISKRGNNISDEVHNISKTLTVDDHSVSLSKTAQNCTEFIFIIMAIDTYQGLLNETSTSIKFYPSEPGTFLDSESALSTQIMFDTEKIPSLRLQVELPSSFCGFHKIDYKIIVENETTALEYGPFKHTGSAILRHDIESVFQLCKECFVTMMLNASVLNTKTYYSNFSTTLPPCNWSTGISSRTSTTLPLIFNLIIAIVIYSIF